jgi:pyruvate/2-oxoacid:ferredoxin oxidoreductase beta subunit
MSNVNKLIDLVNEGKANEFKDLLKEELITRLTNALSEQKSGLSKVLFSNDYISEDWYNITEEDLALMSEDDQKEYNWLVTEWAKLNEYKAKLKTGIQRKNRSQKRDKGKNKTQKRLDKVNRSKADVRMKRKLYVKGRKRRFGARAAMAKRSRGGTVHHQGKY